VGETVDGEEGGEAIFCEGSGGRALFLRVGCHGLEGAIVGG